MDLLFAPEISKEEIGYLEYLTTEHHLEFVKQYPESSVTPKMHFMIHMPRLIQK